MKYLMNGCLTHFILSAGIMFFMRQKGQTVLPTEILTSVGKKK